MESQTGWSGSRTALDEIQCQKNYSSASHKNFSPTSISPDLRNYTTSQAIKYFLSPTRYRSQLLPNAYSDNMTQSSLGSSLLPSPHSRSASDIASIKNESMSSDTSYVRKWLNEAASMISSAKTSQFLQYPGQQQNASNLSTPPLTSNLSTASPLSDSHFSSTTQLSDSQLSSNSSSINTKIIKSSSIKRPYLSSNDPQENSFLHSSISKTSSPVFQYSPPKSSAFSSYRLNMPPPPLNIIETFMPSTPPSSAKTFGSAPYFPSGFGQISSGEDKNSTVRKAAEHFNILQSRLEKVAASQESHWTMRQNDSSDENRGKSDEFSSKSKNLSPCHRYYDSEIEDSDSMTNVAKYNIDGKKDTSKTDVERHESQGKKSRQAFVNKKVSNTSDCQNNAIICEADNPKPHETVFKSFLNIKKYVEHQDMSDISISERVTNILDTIKRNAISDIIKQNNVDDFDKTSVYPNDLLLLLTNNNGTIPDLGSAEWKDKSQLINTKENLKSKLQHAEKDLDLIKLYESTTNTASYNPFLDGDAGYEYINECINPFSEDLITDLSIDSSDEKFNNDKFIAGCRSKRRDSDSDESKTDVRNNKNAAGTPVLSRESSGSFKRKRRCSAEGGSPINIAEECIIKSRVEDEGISEEVFQNIEKSSPILKEGSEFSKTLKGVQSGMDNLTKLTDNVFVYEDDSQNNSPKSIQTTFLPSDERPVVIGGESEKSSFNTVDDHEVVSINENSIKSILTRLNSSNNPQSESTQRVRAYLESLHSRSLQSNSSDICQSVTTALPETPPISAHTSYSSSETPPPISHSLETVGTPDDKFVSSDGHVIPTFVYTTPPHSAGYNTKQPDPLGLSDGNGQPGTLQRSHSCETINSDTSITLDDFEEAACQVIGNLTVTLIYDK